MLDNGLVRVQIDAGGLLSSVFDHRAQREVLAPRSRGNLLRLHTDLPNTYDAWDDVREGGGTTTTLRVSLLRAPMSPDPEADQGHHVQRYTLLVGADIRSAVSGGYALNLPPRMVSGVALSGSVPTTPLVDTDGESVVVEAVKLADDRSGDVIVRLYESLGGHARTVLRTNFVITSAELEDLLEQPLSEGSALDVDSDGSVALSLRPFQVVTIRLRRGLTFSRWGSTWLTLNG